VKRKTALITGICGQDGSYIADLLLEKDYNVFGVMRRNATRDLGNARHLENEIEIVEGDVTDMSSMMRIIQTTRPHELYNMAAMSVHPDTYINTHRIGPGKHTKPVKISDLWSPQRISKYSIRKETVPVEGGEVEAEVIDMPANKNLMVMGYRGGMGQWFPIKQISRHWYKGKLIKLRQKCGEVLVTPNHSVYDIKGSLSSPLENPELLSMRKVNYFNRFPKQDISLKLYDLHEKVIEHNDGWISCESQINKRIRLDLTAEDGSLQAFLRFCGAFVSEGWTTQYENRKHYYVCISQNDKEWLEKLQEDLSYFYEGPSCFIKHKKEGYDDIWRLEISSKILYMIFRKYCGIKSSNKQMPDFIFLLNKDFWWDCLTTLLEGDGSTNEYKNFVNIRYASTSQKLIAQLCLMWSMLGIDYNYSHYTYDNEVWTDKYEIRQVRSYQTNQGTQDYEEIDYEGYVYDISVDEVHNFCAGLGNIVVHNSHVHTSFEQPLATLDIDTKGVVNILESVKILGHTSRILHASTSEMFGSASPPQNMETIFKPQSPYAIAKVASHYFIRLYRESYGMYCCAAVTFNHEGIRRGPNFVTRKITMGVAQALKDPEFKLKLGNLDAERDWGYAPDFVRGFQMALQQEKPDDYIFATNEVHSVREFCEEAFKYAGLNWEDHVEIDRFFMRPAEVDALCGDYSVTKEKLGWKPETKFKDLIRKMVDYDCKLLGVKRKK
jgi:GDP-mannose 4,6-dehydratase